jgi:hypothetical protein
MSGVLGTEAYKNYFGNPVSYRQGGITASMPAGSLVGEFGTDNQILTITELTIPYRFTP